jgi:phosphoribosylglycinamide formyltransferase 1
MTLMRAAFCVSGNGTLFRAAVERSGETGVTAELLITDWTASPELEQFAAERGIAHRTIPRLNREELSRALTNELTTAAVDLVVLTFDRILPPAVVRHFEGRIINVHPSLLPAFPGSNAMDRAIEADVRYGGATIHVVVDDVDAGPVIAQAVVPVPQPRDKAVMGREIYRHLEPMFLQVLLWFAEGRIVLESGKVVVRDANYESLPISPALERFSLRV